jgi:hydroxylysine kinase
MFSGVIHGDLNEKNVLVQSAANGETELVGVIDFGDSSWSPYVYEVAIAIVYAMLESQEIDPFEVGAHILAGYLDDGEQVPLLKKADLSILRTCVAARLATSLTMGAYAYSLDLTNGEYLLGTAKRGWAMLERLWGETTEAELYDIWDAVMRNSYGKSFY